MGILIWLGSGLLGVIIWLVTTANCLSEDAEFFTKEYLSGGALIVYVFMILVGILGCALMMLGSFVIFACWFAENFSMSEKIGHKLYKILCRNKKENE